MDGYAISGPVPIGAQLDVVGEAAAGHGFSGSIRPGQAVRIFTGAPVPDGADRIVIQEDVSRDADTITVKDAPGALAHVRPAGGDFQTGSELSAPRRLKPSDIALLAAMNIANVPVKKRPVVAIIPTGDELVQPGEEPRPDQIIASNSYGLAALLEASGAEPRLLPIAHDTQAHLDLAFELATASDLIVTIGGASVGDHDLVGATAAARGLEQSFYKIAMRPGKPLMAGRLGSSMMIGLPGNPVSAMVCGHIFVAPVIRKMLGYSARPASRHTVKLAHDIGPNGPREHYMRATQANGEVTIFDRQDSSLLTVLADANCLAVRAPHDPPRKAGENIDIVQL